MRVKFNIPDDRGKLYEVIHFPAGEIQVRLTKAGIAAIGEKRVEAYEIEANPIPDFMELAQLDDAICAQMWSKTQYIPEERKLFLPYLPFARADRRFVEGDAAGFNVFMRLLETLRFTSVWTFDAHNPDEAKRWGISNMLPTDSAIDQIRPFIRKFGRKGLVLILPDKGAAKRYDLRGYKLPFIIAEKTRDAKTGKLSGFKISPLIAHFQRALVIDDICDGGGTFIGLAEAISKRNPDIKLALYVSHGIFSKGCDVLHQAGYEKLCISDYSFKGREYDQFKPIGEKK